MTAMGRFARFDRSLSCRFHGRRRLLGLAQWRQAISAGSREGQVAAEEIIEHFSSRTN